MMVEHDLEELRNAPAMAPSGARALTLPTITVVTPSFNAAATIEETLRSVREQDYPYVEHVVVDGASTDGTVEILERAEGVRFVSEPDRGLSHAMNKGVAMASGSIIGWLNADDIYLPGALRAIGEAFAACPQAEWATGRCLIVDEAGREIRKGATAYKNFFLRRYSHCALPHAELHLGAGDLRAPRGLSAPSLPRGLRDVDGLRRLPAVRAGRRPDRPRSRPGLLSHDGGHALDVELRAPVRRARRAGARPWRRPSGRRSPSTRR